MTEILTSLQRERAKYGATMTDDQCVELINAVAWAHRADGWGVNAKDFGTHGVRYDGARLAHDILHHKPTDRIYDVLASAGAASVPVWQDKGPNTQPPNQGRSWVAPIAPLGAVEPEPGEPPVVPPPACACGYDPAPVLAALESLSALVGGLTDELLAQRQVQADTLDTARQALAEAKDVSARLRAGLRVEASARFVGPIRGVVQG